MQHCKQMVEYHLPDGSIYVVVSVGISVNQNMQIIVY